MLPLISRIDTEELKRCISGEITQWKRRRINYTRAYVSSMFEYLRSSMSRILLVNASLNKKKTDALSVSLPQI